MYKIVAKNSKKKITPYYKVVFKYMIGDCDGHQDEETRFSENDFTENIQKRLHALQKFSNIELQNCWAIAFDHESIKAALEQEKITEEEYDIIKSEIDEDENSVFWEGPILNYSDCGNYYIQDIVITYTDENNSVYKVKWKD